MSNYKTDDKQRVYYIEELDMEVPSVTTIIGQYDKSAPLMYWAVKVAISYLQDNPEALKLDPYETFRLAKKHPRLLKEQAAELGSGVHYLIEQHLKGFDVKELISKSPEMKPAFEAFLSWQKQYDFKLVQSEHTVWSVKEYAGTLDCVAWLNGKLYLVDFKTSNAIFKKDSKGKLTNQLYETYIWQVAAYWYAYQEHSNKKLEGLGILRLDKVTGLPEWAENSKDIPLINIAPKAFLEFEHLLKLWWQIKENKEV